MKIKESILVMFPIIVCFIAVIISYNSTISVRKLERGSTEDIQLLKNEILNLASEVKNINAKLSTQSKKVVMQLHDKNPNQTKDWLDLIDSDLQKIEKTLSKTGLDLLATNDVNPVLLKEMFAEFSEKKELETYQKDLRNYNSELHESDKNNYDPEIAKLYETAKFKMRRGANRENQETAFKEILDKYPDSYSAGMLIAEKAIGASFRGKTEDIEKYYKMLNDNENFGNIVIDWGAEAIPTIQSQLANRYISEGRIDEAKEILDKLGERDENSYILAPRPDRRRPSWQKTSDIVNGLNNKL